MPMSHFPDVDDLSVVVVGDVMLDKYWFGSVERISPEAPVPVISVASAETRPGGAANVACNLSSLGAKVTLCGLTGDDAAAQELNGLLNEAKIDTRMVSDNAFSTIEKLRLVARNQQLLRADFEKMPAADLADALNSKVASSLSDADVLVLSDYAKGSLSNPQVLIQMAIDQQVPTVVDPKGRDFERYRQATYLTPNEGEFEAVAGSFRDEQEMADKACSLAQHLDVEALIVTRSEKGISMFRKSGEVMHSPARAREVFDVTGAGDTVVAVLATTYSSLDNDEQRLAFANAAAGVVVARQGTERVSRDDINAAIDRSLA